MAVSLCLSLASCTQGGGTTPMGESLAMLWGGSQDEHQAQAEAIPYGSLLVTMEGNTALVVLAHQGGAEGEHTLWQAGDLATLELRHGRPFSSAGFDRELLGLTYQDAQEGSDRYSLSVHWREADGQEHIAQGQASLSCTAARPLELPLTTLPLERCTERVDWTTAGTSRNTLWRHPITRRPWAGDIQPWPGAQRIEWQVARPWWVE